MIYLRVPSLPPSTNHAYFNLPRGGRTLTSAGKKYKRETAAHISQRYPKEMATLKPDVPYLLHVRFHLSDLENKTWPTSAKTRYKRIDASNRLKLLEDVLAEVAGIDDAQNLMIILEKCQGAEEYTEIWVWNLEVENESLSRLLTI